MLFVMRQKRIGPLPIVLVQSNGAVNQPARQISMFAELWKIPKPLPKHIYVYSAAIPALVDLSLHSVEASSH